MQNLTECQDSALVSAHALSWLLLSLVCGLPERALTRPQGSQFLNLFNRLLGSIGVHNDLLVFVIFALVIPESAPERNLLMSLCRLLLAASPTV
jgi:hypothetical protein